MSMTPEELDALVATVEPAAGPETSSWAPVDLGDVLAGDDDQDRPRLLARTNGSPLLYPGRLHTIHGETESLKTWVALEACRQELAEDRRVLYLDFEDSARGIVGRLRAMAVPDDLIEAGFAYARPAERLSDRTWADLRAALAAGPSLVVVDGVTEAMTIEGLSLLDNADVATFYERLPRPLCRFGPAVVLLDHVTKAKEGRGRFALGAQAKVAGLDGASYYIETVLPFGRGRSGLARLFLAKDRLGFVAEGSVGARRQVAEVKASSSSGVEIRLEPPADRRGAFRPTFLMERVSRTLEETAPGGLSVRSVEESVRGKATAVRLALELLVAEGYVTVEAGPRNARFHHSVRPYREATDAAADEEPPGAVQGALPGPDPF